MIFEEQIALEPDHYPWTDKFIEAMHNGFWTHKEFNFQSDLQDFKVKLNDQEREIITRALSTIAQLEISVKTFWARIGDNLPHPSIKDLGYVMANVEVIHGRAYKRLLEVVGIKDYSERLLKTDLIRGRVNYLRKHLHKFHADNRKQFIYSLILFTLFVENIALFSQFYTIMWFKRHKNVLKDLDKQVEYTSREENLHAQVGITLINQIREEHPEYFDDELKDKILHEAEQMVNYECGVIKWIIGEYNEDELNVPVLEALLKNRMNVSLKDIFYDKVFDVDKKTLAKTKWFDEQILGNNATDFFSARPTEYAKKDKSFDESDLFE